MVPEKVRKSPIDTQSVGTTSLKEGIASSPPERQQVQLTRPEDVPVAMSEAQSRPAQASGVVYYRGPVLAPEERGENPYTGSKDMQPYYPQPSPFQTRVLEEERVDDLEPWKTDHLPWYLPRRRPHITGRIISMHNEMEFPDYPNVLRALADLMAEFLWIAANQPSHREGERVQVTILRIRTIEGHLRDARLMG
ncbi:MAG: hypothetical protein JO011_17300, partial [Ktedonobacteraceae bacterium]|nr:hypothetical protein [Ktedonobacteraceae bacterium]